MKPLLTVMLPSRGRPKGLRKTMESFLHIATNPDSVEFIVKLDDDDKQDIIAGPATKILIGPRLLGYESLHTFCNEMLLIASGTWIMLGNDDATMLTEGWDDILRQEEPRCILLNQRNEHGDPTPIFPIVNREICLEIGHFSLNAFTDRWLQHIYEPIGLTKDIPLRIKHDIIKDQSSEDRKTAIEYSTQEWEDTETERAVIRASLQKKYL